MYIVSCFGFYSSDNNVNRAFRFKNLYLNNTVPYCRDSYQCKDLRGHNSSKSGPECTAAHPNVPVNQDTQKVVKKRKVRTSS